MEKKCLAFKTIGIAEVPYTRYATSGNLLHLLQLGYGMNNVVGPSLHTVLNVRLDYIGSEKKNEIRLRTFEGHLMKAIMTLDNPTAAYIRAVELNEVLIGILSLNAPEE